MRMVDVAVVGGGVQGLMAAYFISSLGMDVLVLERTFVGAGSSGRNHGGIRATHPTFSETKMGAFALELWEELAERLEVDIEFRQNGYLFIAYSDSELKEYKRQVYVHHEAGVKSQLLSPKEVVDLAPVVSPEGITGGMFYQRNGTANPFAVTRALAQTLAKAGHAVLQGCPVKTIAYHSGGFTLSSPLGKVRASKVVLATGVSGAELLAQLGIDIPLSARKRQSIVTERLAPFLGPLIVTPWGSMVQTIRGEILATCPEESDTSPNDFSTTRSFLEKTSNWMCKVVPRLQNVRVLRQWAGHYTVTPDRRPVIGVTSVEGLYVSLGWANTGFMMSPAVGYMLSQLIAKEETSALMEPYRIDRFSKAVGKPEKSGGQK